jgi:hypothetical protein
MLALLLHVFSTQRVTANAQTLATLEAFVGQLYLAVLVARLLHISDSMKQPTGES